MGIRPEKRQPGVGFEQYIPSIFSTCSADIPSPMDIADFQNRLTDFMISQMTQGPGNTAEAQALRAELDEAIKAYGDQMPELRDLATQLDLLAEVAQNPELAAQIAENATKEYEPNPKIFDAIDDGDLDAVKAALTSWDVNATHGEFECTALYQAMSNMFGVSPPMAHLLLDAGADPKVGLGTSSNVLHGLGFSRCDGVTPEDLAKVITRCVALGADIEQRSNRLGWTPLITAASEWNPVAVEALLLAGADIDAHAGEVEGVCFSGEPGRAFADGDPATLAVFERFSVPN